MQDLITESFYRAVSYALFARHQLLFSFYLSAKTLMHRGGGRKGTSIVTENEFRWLIHDMKDSILSTGQDDDIMFSPRTGTHFRIFIHEED